MILSKNDNKIEEAKIVLELSNRKVTEHSNLINLSRDLEAARQAHKAGDISASKAAHEVKALENHGAVEGDVKKNHIETHGGIGGNVIKSLIFGGLDGIITTFSIVSASVGAGFGVDVIILMGVANLIADGISMGVGDYLSSKAEFDFATKERQREMWEVENGIEGEKKEMIEIYKGKGMNEDDAFAVVDIFSKYKEMFVDLMMVEELGLEVPSDPNAPWKDGVVTFIAFIVFGSVPLWMYVFFKIADRGLSSSIMFALTCVATAITMFLLGILKARITKQANLESGALMLSNGSLAAAAAYLVGWMFEELL